MVFPIGTRASGSGPRRSRPRAGRRPRRCACVRSDPGRVHPAARAAGVDLATSPHCSPRLSQQSLQWRPGHLHRRPRPCARRPRASCRRRVRSALSGPGRSRSPHSYPEPRSLRSRQPRHRPAAAPLPFAHGSDRVLLHADRRLPGAVHLRPSAREVDGRARRGLRRDPRQPVTVQRSAHAAGSRTARGRDHSSPDPARSRDRPRPCRRLAPTPAHPALAQLHRDAGARRAQAPPRCDRFDRLARRHRVGVRHRPPPST